MLEGHKKENCLLSSPLVSIITPAYNASNYIGRTIESVQAQTHQNWEMIITNDCSQDDTYAVVMSYVEKDSRIRILQSEKNGGVSRARNLAMQKANGRFYAFLDSDDLWFPEKLEKQIDYMLKNDIAFTFTSYELIDENDSRLGKFVNARKYMNYKNVIKNTLIGCLTVVIDKEKTGSFEMPIVSHAEDTMVWAEILSRGFIAYGIPDVLSLYRVSSNSMTANKIKMAKLQWSVYRDYCKFSVLKSGYYFCWYAVNAITKIKNRPAKWKI